MYTYSATVTGVYDGDTVTVDIDLGLGVWLRGQKIRLFGINAPEVRGKSRSAGIDARDWLRSEILGQSVVLNTIKDKTGKYGRWLAVVRKNGVSINDKLVSTGHATPYN
ncbi:thermonuclease family protein [Pseudomaricurvus alkylphenolicus]|nr:thermonuclease family protein [Pseudomaricurvus alkylphenolicus]